MLHVVASATQKGGKDGSIPRDKGRQRGRGVGGLQIKVTELGDRCVAVGQYSISWHAASPGSHTLPSALGWKRMFGSRGRPRSPARGGKEALTVCEAVPLCRPHRTSHLGRGGGSGG